MEIVGYTKIVSFENLNEEGKKKEAHNCNIKKENRGCLFCFNHAPDVGFHKIAHAISETVGNKILVSYFECDECNTRFGELLEDSLGKYMLPFKMITQVYGKKNKLVAKDNSEDDSLTYGRNIL